jgi:hypothetical protein
MANDSFIPYKLTGVRVTLLNSCGVPVDSTCSFIVDTCIVSVEETGEFKDREEWFFENGDGNFCATATTAPKPKFLNLTLTFNDTNPQLANFLTGNTVLLDDATTPNKIGYGWDFGSQDIASFALEGWTRIAAECNDLDGCNASGTADYGYTLYPWVKEGTLGDFTMQNDLANFVVNAIAVRNSPWGTGPYNVYLSEAAATLGVPMPLFSAVPATRFKQMSLTKLPPALASPNCDCEDLTPTIVMTDTGTGLHHGTLTLPLRNGTPIVPGYITWGDATAAQLVTSGTTILHNYSAGGTYTVTYKPTGFSSPSYTTAPTVIA